MKYGWEEKVNLVSRDDGLYDKLVSNHSVKKQYVLLRLQN